MDAAVKGPRFPGHAITLGGETFIVPPLALGALKRLQDKIASVSVAKDGTPSLGNVADMLEICAAALQRNYPEMTVDGLAELVDLGNFAPLCRAVMGQSGLEVVERTEGTAGNA